MRSVFLLPGLLLLSSGCLREAAPPEALPRVPVAAPGYHWPPVSRLADGSDPSQAAPLPVTYAQPPPALAAPESPSSQPPSAQPAPPVVIPKTPLTGGEVCLLELASEGIAHRALDSRRGVSTPVLVEGPLGGVRYVGGAGLPLELDCRMALALHRVGPILRAESVEALRFSGAYVYRQTRKGRLSLHAYGLAIDVHAARVDGRWLEVKTDFTRGGGCSRELPVLNRLACSLKQTGLFKELLTPDYDADHHDHFHLGIEAVPEVAPTGGGSRQARAAR